MDSKKIKHKEKVLKNYNAYLLACDKIRNHPKISLSQLQRTLRPFCKTVLSNDIHLYIRMKGTEKSISIQLLPPYVFQKCHYFKIVSSNYQSFDIQFSAINTFDLMRKINHKFQLLNPFEND